MFKVRTSFECCFGWWLRENGRASGVRTTNSICGFSVRWNLRRDDVSPRIFKFFNFFYQVYEIYLIFEFSFLNHNEVDRSGYHF